MFLSHQSHKTTISADGQNTTRMTNHTDTFHASSNHHHHHHNRSLVQFMEELLRQISPPEIRMNHKQHHEQPLGGRISIINDNARTPSAADHSTPSSPFLQEMILARRRSYSKSSLGGTSATTASDTCSPSSISTLLSHENNNNNDDDDDDDDDDNVRGEDINDGSKISASNIMTKNPLLSSPEEHGGSCYCTTTTRPSFVVQTNTTTTPSASASASTPCPPPPVFSTITIQSTAAHAAGNRWNPSVAPQPPLLARNPLRLPQRRFSEGDDDDDEQVARTTIIKDVLLQKGACSSNPSMITSTASASGDTAIDDPRPVPGKTDRSSNNKEDDLSLEESSNSKRTSTAPPCPPSSEERRRLVIAIIDQATT